MSRLLGQRPFLSGKTRQQSRVRDAIEPRELLSPTDLEPAFGSPVDQDSYVRFGPEGDRRWEAVGRSEARIIAYLVSSFEFPTVGQAFALDFVNQSYTITNAEGGVETRELLDLVGVGRQQTALTVAPNGTFRRLPGEIPRIEFNPSTQLGVGMRLEPEGSNLLGNTNKFDAGQTLENITATPVPNSSFDGFEGDGVPGRVWRLQEIEHTGDRLHRLHGGRFGYLSGGSVSFYAKAGTRNHIIWHITDSDIGYNFNLTSGVVLPRGGLFPANSKAVMSPAPDGFWRCQVWNWTSGTPGSPTYVHAENLRLALARGGGWGGADRLYPSDGSGFIYLAGLQAEPNNTSTSYVHNEGSSVGQRDVENAHLVNAEISRLYGPNGRGCVYIESNINNKEKSPLIFGFAANTDSNLLALFMTPEGHLRARIRVLGSDTLDVTLAVEPSISGITKDLISWSPEGIIVARNGVAQQYSAVELPNAVAIQRGLIGGGLIGAGDASGQIRRISSFSQPRSLAQAQALTAI